MIASFHDGFGLESSFYAGSFLDQFRERVAYRLEVFHNCALGLGAESDNKEGKYGDDVFFHLCSVLCCVERLQSYNKSKYCCYFCTNIFIAMTENHNKTLSPELKEKLSKIKHLALDMDGTIYMGSTLFPFTTKFLADMKEAGISYSFLTNNPSKSVADYLKKLEALGIDANEDNMYTTSLAAIDYIKSHYPEAKRLFLLGTPSMITQFEKAGYISCADDPDDVPDVLVVAFDMSLEYSRLCRASWWASQGIPYVATNPDRVCPTDQRTVLVDCGSMTKCIEHATGRQPDVCVGKPDPNMLRGVFERYGYKPEEVAMVGDRIYTDTATAHNAGAFGVLVLSGETTLEVAEKVAEDARTNPAPEFFPPDIIVRDVKELGELLLANR